MDKEQLQETFLSINFNKKRGVSLLEALLVLFIFTFSLLKVFKTEKNQKEKVNNSIEKINYVFQKSLASSILEGKIVEVRFFFNDEMVIKNLISSFSKNNEDKKEVNTIISENIGDIIAESLIISGKDEFSGGKKTKETFIYVYPEGYSQEFSLNIKSLDGKINERLYLDPFLSILKREENEKE